MQKLAIPRRELPVTRRRVRRSQREKRRRRQNNRRAVLREERRLSKRERQAERELDECRTIQEISAYLYRARHGLNKQRVSRPAPIISNQRDRDHSHEASHEDVVRTSGDVSNRESVKLGQDTKRYVIHALVAGDGVHLHRGRIYASSKKTPKISDENTFWETEMDPSMDLDMFKGYGCRGFDLPTKYLEVNKKPVRIGMPTPLHISSTANSDKQTRLRAILEAVKSYLLDRRNAGVCVRISWNSARAYNPMIAVQHIFHLGRTFITKGIFNCAEAAYINAVWLCRGEEIGLKVALSLYHTGIECFHDRLSLLGASMHRHKWYEHKCELRVVKLPSVPDVLDWMVTAEPGVYLVRLEDVEGSNHTVCLDLRNNKRAIWDNEEPFPVRLTARNMQLCGGPKSWIKEIRRVHPMPMV